MKRKIGVVPRSDLVNKTQSTRDDVYRLGNNYCKRVLEAGALPLCVTPVDNWVPEESLAMYDGYIVQGGSEFYPYHFQIIHDAIVNHKPYLGICLGEQLIHAYFTMKQMAEEEGYQGDPVKAICALLEDRGPSFSVLERVQGHYRVSPPRGEAFENIGYDWLAEKFLRITGHKLTRQQQEELIDDLRSDNWTVRDLTNKVNSFLLG